MAASTACRHRRQSIDQAAGVDLEKGVEDAAAAYGMPSGTVADLVETEVQNVCSRGFGLLVQRDDSTDLMAVFLTHRNDRVPLVVTDTFYTVIDNQSEVFLQVFEQGGSEESDRPEDNNVLISGSITGIPPGHGKGTAVNISFSMGSDLSKTLETVSWPVRWSQPYSVGSSSPASCR